MGARLVSSRWANYSRVVPENRVIAHKEPMFEEKQKQRQTAQFADVLGVLDGIELELEMSAQGKKTPALKKGESMIKALGPGHDVNVIPGGTKGNCHPVLIVAIGVNDDNPNERILEAIEHVTVHCPGNTTAVVFWAAWWDALAWAAHKSSFKGVEVILKLVGSKPSKL